MTRDILSIDIRNEPFPPPSSQSGDYHDDKDDQDDEIYPYEGDKDTDIISVSTDSSSDESDDDDDEGTDSDSHPGDGAKSVIDSPFAAPEKVHVLNNKPTVVSKLGLDPQPIDSPKMSIAALPAAANRQITGDMEAGGSSSQPQPSNKPRANGAPFVKAEWSSTQKIIEMSKKVDLTKRETERLERELEEANNELQSVLRRLEEAGLRSDTPGADCRAWALAPKGQASAWNLAGSLCQASLDEVETQLRCLDMLPAKYPKTSPDDTPRDTLQLSGVNEILEA
ncbi:hypothetical protein VPNG_01179 [Cytospora leucostoma]|uniref:Uncharacterized protein n=1 Tax=Cytospora leucostoma TaxID=1230097 RepID=A0A423XKK3_9PEZI|nr:hypothetical protein VPNG_01179 [Cytospora leucostoma]